MTKFHPILLASLGLIAIASAFAMVRDASLDNWTPRELTLIESLSIDQLGEPPKDPSNKYADDSLAIILGKAIFNDSRFSANGKISCATCHISSYNFTDALPLAKGIETFHRRSMPIVGMAYQSWFFWDGRTDALWAQALAPLESPLEHGISRTHCAQLVQQYYSKEYEALTQQKLTNSYYQFPSFARPDKSNIWVDSQWEAISERDQQAITQIYVNVGKSIAAFVRTLNPSPSKFDLYAQSLTNNNKRNLDQLSPRQTKGLKVFLNKGGCINCHNGPLFTNGEFHHVGIPDHDKTDIGRAAVIDNIAENEFGCMSKWSDANPLCDCESVRFLNKDKTRAYRAFKTPSLRNVAQRAPYMHAGQFSSLKEVLQHYQKISEDGTADEIFHDELSNQEIDYLVEFLQSLNDL